MEYAHRMTKEEQEHDDMMIKAGRRGVFRKCLPQSIIDSYLSESGRVEKHRTMDEIHDIARSYKDELHKELHR